MAPTTPTITNPTDSNKNLTIFNNTDTSSNGTNNVNHESFNVDAGLWSINVPGTDMDSATILTIPLTGSIATMPKKRIILVSGAFSGTDPQIKAFVEEVDNVAKDPFQPRRNYLSTFNKSYGMQINGFTYERSLESPNILSYTIEMYVSVLVS